MHSTPSNILIVEDHPGDAELLEIHLSSFVDGRAISTVQTLCDARDALAETPDAIVLLDLGLPDAQGLDGLNALLRHPNINAIIVLTGMSDHELAIEALRMGAQDYIHKNNFNRDDLRRAIQYAVARAEHARLERALKPTRDLATIGRLVSAYSHQIKNPLSFIHSSNGFIGTLVEPLRQACQDEESRAHLDDLSACAQDIQEGVGRIRTIADSISSYSKLPSAVDEDLTLSDVVSMALAMLPQVDAARVLVDVHENIPLPVAHDLLIFSLSALIENAARFAFEARDVIVVDAESANGVLSVRVRDHGPGFTPEAMKKGAQAFFTTEPHRSGLGLTLAREVALAYQGTLKIENHPEGGAAVTLELPLSAFS
jgi:signal transduction histidine kinase